MLPQARTDRLLVTDVDDEVVMDRALLSTGAAIILGRR